MTSQNAEVNPIETIFPSQPIVSTNRRSLWARFPYISGLTFPKLPMQLIDETAADLQKLIERDFGRLGGPPTDRDVIDWMHYRARLIPRRLRAVTVSQEVVAQMATYPAIGQLRSELERGEDVSPWLSDRVRNRKQYALADLMFNDWQISHFHLGRFFVSPNKVHRQKLLLFALVKADRAVFLDVHPHGRRTWTTTQILRVLLQTSPQDMPEWKGALGTQSGDYTDTELLRLREGGLGYTIQIDGRIFSPPGGGSALLGTLTVSCGNSTTSQQKFETCIAASKRTTYRTSS
jgi:hypothetical protein